MDDVAPAGVGPAPIIDVGVGTPEVRASMLALEAPAKATDCVEAAGLGAAEVLLGFRTLWAESAKPVADNEMQEDELINDVYHTVSDQNIRCNDLGAVHEYIAAVNGYGEVNTIHGHDRLILKG